MVCLLALAALLTQDRADLPSKVETWYKVVQSGRHVGYGHETLSTAAGARYEYALQGEFALKIAGKDYFEDQSLTGLLDDAFLPVVFAGSGHAGDAAVSMTILAVDQERRAEIVPASGKSASFSVPAGDDLHAALAPMLFALRQNGVLAKPGRVSARLFDPRGLEKGGVDVILEVQETVRREYLGREVPCTPVRFLKPAPAGIRATEIVEATVDRFGRILESRMQGGARIVIARDQEEAVKGAQIFPGRWRNDPMDRETALRNAARARLLAERGPVETPLLTTPDSLRSDLTAAEKMVDEIRARQDAGQPDEARAVYFKVLARWKEMRPVALRSRPELLPQIDQVREAAEALVPGASRARDEARVLHATALEGFEREECESMERALRDLAQLRERIELELRPEQIEIAQKIGSLKTLVVRCRTRQELGRLKLEVDGITLSAGETVERVDASAVVFGHVVGAEQAVPFVRRKDLASINGRTYRVGDAVEGTEVRVESMKRQGVTVSLRDEVRELPLRPR